MTKNFKLEEFSCKCGCGESRISPTVVLICQIVRDFFGKPVFVTSGCRCEIHNSKVGGKDNSLHLPKRYDEQCHAADITVKDTKPKDVYSYLDTIFPNSLGLGLYNEFVHIDDRIDKAYRW